MTPAETIQAAIDKLERLRRRTAANEPGVWIRGEELWSGALRWELARRNQFEQVFSITNDGDGIGAFGDTDTVDLIVTLHATIDAQLALLKLAVANYWEPGTAPDDWESFDESRKVLDLARAILGEDA